MNFEFEKQKLVQTIYDCNITKGDILFLQISLGRVGLVKESESNYLKSIELVFDSFQEVIGIEGTLIVPSYTYSLSSGEVFDVDKTPSKLGDFSEIFRKRKNVYRSEDPILSHCLWGRNAKKLAVIKEKSCFGKNSFFDISKLHGMKLCTLGLAIYNSTFIHHIEEMNKVPFRYKKSFTGEIVKNEKSRIETWEYFAAPRIYNCSSNPIALQEKVIKRKKLIIRNIGRGQIMCIDSRDYFKIGSEELKINPWLTAFGPPLKNSELNKLFRSDKGIVGN